MANLNYPYIFEGGEKAVASEVNANFDAIKLYADAINAQITAIQSAIGDLEKKPTREMFDIYYSIRSEAPAGAYPLWTGETITNAKLLYPDFWKELNLLAGNSAVPTVESNDAYDKMVSDYGECPCFYIDTLNGHVRLPKIVSYITNINTASDLGTVLKAQMPQHRHFIANGASGGSTYVSLTASNHLTQEGGASATQAISYRLNGTATEATKGLTSGVTGSDVSAGTSLRPQTVRLCLYFQVSNNTAEVSELNTEVIAEQLSAALDDMKAAYNGYATALNAEYEKIKGQIADAAKVYKFYNTVVSKADWQADETFSEYPFAAEIPLLNVTPDLVPTVVFGVEDIASGNFAPVAETGNERVKIFAKAIPAADITIPTIMCQ